MTQSVQSIQHAFSMQAKACSELESPFMARLMQLLATRELSAGPVAECLYHWAGDATYAGDSVPLRFAGALHALVLDERCSSLKQVYPPQDCTEDALWAAVEDAADVHSKHILHWFESAPQTNEVRRSAVIYAGLSCIAEQFPQPQQLLEVGSSAGLNLLPEKYAICFRDQVHGVPDSPVVLTPDWTGASPPEGVPDIVGARGCDLNPLDIDSADDRLRMQSYIWADQADRLSRTAAAIELARKHHMNVTKMNAPDWLAATMKKPQSAEVRVIFHTIVWQYLDQESQKTGQRIITNAGSNATQSSPLAWLRLEADGGTEPGAALTLTLWPGGTTHCIARADFHGRWIDWRGWPD